MERESIGVQVAELAGGLLSLAVQGVILWGVLELACWVFFKVREGKGK